MRHLAHLSLVSMLMVAVTAHAASDPHIALVENGLLPIAARHPGITSKISQRMRAYGVPGLSIAVIDHGEIVWAKGYGVTDTSSKRPVTPQTLFEAASISKPISAVGVLLLAQSGRVRLDEPANDALKSWKIPPSTFTKGTPVTIRMLLNHSAGVDHVGSGRYVPYSPGQSVPSLLQVLRGETPSGSGPVRVVATPGTAFVYSGAGYEILQQLVSDVSGKSFEDYMQGAVLEPIRMSRSTFAQPLPESLRRDAATGHYAGGQPLDGRYRIGPELAVAGLWTTPTDVARYIISVQQSFQGAKGDPLDPEMAREMLTPGLGGRGLGPALKVDGGSIRFGHDGFNEGFESSFVGYTSRGQGAVVMANSGFAFMLIEEVLDSISRAYGWPDTGETTQRPPGSSTQQQMVIPVPTKALAANVGRYALDDQVQLRFYAKGRRLFLDWPLNGTAEVFWTATGRYFCPQLTFSDLGSPWLRFITGKDGRAEKIIAGYRDSAELRRID